MEITLYRFGRGECCVLTADSIIGDRVFPACAQVEEEAEVALIPAATFDAWLAASPLMAPFFRVPFSGARIRAMDRD